MNHLLACVLCIVGVVIYGLSQPSDASADTPLHTSAAAWAGYAALLEPATPKPQPPQKQPEQPAEKPLTKPTAALIPPRAPCGSGGCPAPAVTLPATPKEKELPNVHTERTNQMQIRRGRFRGRCFRCR